MSLSPLHAAVRSIVALASAISLSLLTGCAETGVDVSSDGGQVAVSHNGSLWVADVEKENWRRIPVGGAHALVPTWSPDGRYLLFQLAPQKTDPDAQTGSPVQPGAEHSPSTDERAWAALYDSQTNAVTRLASDVGPPFAWKPDSRAYVAVQNHEGAARLAWFDTAGAPLRTVNLPEGTVPIERLVWLPQSDDAAFIGWHEVAETSRADLFRTQGDAVAPLTRSGRIVGAGYSAALDRLLWADAEREDNPATLALHSYDPSTGTVARLPFPPTMPFLQLSPNRNAAIQSVVFPASGARMAIVVQVMSRSKSGEESDVAQTACYSVETDGDGACLVRQTGDGAATLHPAWSRDGRRLVILENSGDEGPRLFVYNYDGTGKRMASLPAEDASPPPTP